jgi:hypothetical protein
MISRPRLLLAASLLTLCACAAPGDDSEETGHSSSAQNGSIGDDEGGQQPPVTTESGPPVSFGDDVLPIFAAHCVECHAGATDSGVFDLTAQRAAVSLFERTPATICFEDGEPVQRDYVVPGEPEASLLWLKISDTDFSLECGREMPPLGEGPLLDFDPASAETLRRWMEQGAPVSAEL